MGSHQLNACPVCFATDPGCARCSGRGFVPAEEGVTILILKGIVTFAAFVSIFVGAYYVLSLISAWRGQ